MSLPVDAPTSADPLEPPPVESLPVETLPVETLPVDPARPVPRLRTAHQPGLSAASAVLDAAAGREDAQPYPVPTSPLRPVARPVAVIAEALHPVTDAELGPGVDVRRVDGGDRAALLAAVRDAQALLVRSGTVVDEELLAAAPRLKVVARAGTGLRNVDVRACTHAGVMVVTAPTANLVSAAELTVGLMIAAARRVGAAHASLRHGEWQRDRFVGTELHGKTLGILGLGRVGVLVAQRMAAFGMRLVAHDPFVQAGRAAQLGVQLVDLDTLLRESDVLSVHLPRTTETLGLLGREQLARVKPGLVLVNAARGGIVDECALYDALLEGRVGAAGIDTFAEEPAAGNALLALDNVVATPHLGASTEDALEKAGRSVARSVRQALSGELVPDAVNVHGGVIAEEVRPSIGLTERLGRLFTGLSGGSAVSMDVEARGELADHDVRVLELAALKGALSGVVLDDSVSYVNVSLLAAERGTAVRLITDPESPDHRTLVTVRGTLADAHQVSVSGTLVGTGERQRLVAVDGIDLDVELADHLAFLRHPDRPGTVGVLGQVLGAAGVNIAGMQVVRLDGEVLVALALDSAVPQPVLDTLGNALSASWARTVSLV
ncbi:phosphoglycerate dehydrogenase [Nocardioides bruguierae]|uniref:D-3-phosphoglycerate dehydrogenase n=1 Tax=Nocardioides bruguierae TaxID=2945102 RepID=A0A9X2D7X8_9ACTN|nr:phosphoglycerate dehydrogenase [Nocardioides bruguierae]MCM0619724.1 phosphoglycerate dehydrogenase [Nocardioides bruguierae]